MEEPLGDGREETNCDQNHVERPRETNCDENHGEREEGRQIVARSAGMGPRERACDQKNRGVREGGWGWGINCDQYARRQIVTRVAGRGRKSEMKLCRDLPHTMTFMVELLPFELASQPGETHLL